jgi:hypothetical protein
MAEFDSLRGLYVLSKSHYIIQYYLSKSHSRDDKEEGQFTLGKKKVVLIFSTPSHTEQGH